MSGYQKKPSEGTATQGTTRQGSDISVGTTLRPGTKDFAETEGGGIRDDEKTPQQAAASGGFLGGIMETMAAALNPKNTQLADFPQELMDQVVDGTVLRFAFGPTDMKALALGDEKKALELVGNVFTVNNPSPEVMEYMLQSEKFTDLVWSGHGAREGLFTTGADGKADMMDNETIAGMLENSSIEEVFFAVCNGGNKLDDMVNETGIDTYAYNRQVGDDEAIGDLESFVGGGDLDDIEERMVDIDLGMWGGSFSFNAGGEHQRGRRAKPAAPAAPAPAVKKPPIAAAANAGTDADLGAMGYDLSGIDYGGMNGMYF